MEEIILVNLKTKKEWNNFLRLKTKVSFLYGPVGVGKTCFVRSFFQQVFPEKKNMIVKSPTFCILKEYEGLNVIHGDFYRLKEFPKRTKEIMDYVLEKKHEMPDLTVFIEHPVKNMGKCDFKIVFS